MQLSRRARAPGVGIPLMAKQIYLTGGKAKRRGFFTTGREIVKRETPLGLYKGLGAVMTGIVPKMAIRFTSNEWYRQMLANKSTGVVSGQATFVGESTYGPCFIFDIPPLKPPFILIITARKIFTTPNQPDSRRASLKQSPS